MKNINYKIYNTPLNVDEILSSWHNEILSLNFGAFVSFIGIIRDENNIDGLSFDIYEPLLIKWLNSWDDKMDNAKLFFAHSRGDVLLKQCSFMCAISSAKRRFALEQIDEFVESFKANAPIWKYDLCGGVRVFADDRSKPLNGAGILKNF